ncbi:MAG: TetR family transcriptional regulator [Pseudomonadota bacterium]|nr:TetR family transcriptional regulator [Pseudomonadota bacterium]
MHPESDPLDRAADTLLALAAERPWPDISLRAVAEAAGLPLTELYASANSKAALLAHLSARFDRAALATAATASDDAHDRLFDAVMARVEAMEPHRAALTAIARAAGPLALVAHFPPTARAILEAAGLDANPPRLAAMTALWARIAQVWRDDEGALNRTMAEIDKRLKQMRSRLGRIGAGF